MSNFIEKPNLDEYNQSAFLNSDNIPFDLKKYLLYTCISGSHAYGTATETSDIDIRGVFYLPEEYIFGLLNCENISSKTEDIIYSSIKKFVGLGIKNNVHAIEMMFLQDKHVQFMHPLFRDFLINYRETFLSKNIGYSCGGYAFQQVRTALTKQANNTGRKQLIEKYGIDTKLLSHCVRIYRMGREILEGNNPQVYRKDASFLLDIRNGKYSVEELLITDKDKNGKMIITGGIIGDEYRMFQESWEKTKLPDQPYFQEIQNGLIQLNKNLYKEN